MSMESVCVRVAVRPDAGGVGRAKREFDARRGARARRERPAAQVHAQRIRHASARGDRPLPTPPYTGFLSCFLFFLCSFFFSQAGSVPMSASTMYKITQIIHLCTYFLLTFFKCPRNVLELNSTYSLFIKLKFFSRILQIFPMAVANQFKY